MAKAAKGLDLVSRLNQQEEVQKRFKLKCVSPDDGKYVQGLLEEYLTP